MSWIHLMVAEFPIELESYGFSGRQLTINANTDAPDAPERYCEINLESSNMTKIFMSLARTYKHKCELISEVGNEQSDSAETLEYNFPMILAVRGWTLPMLKYIVGIIENDASQYAKITISLLESIKNVHTSNVFEKVFTIYVNHVIGTKNHPDRENLVYYMIKWGTSDTNRLCFRLITEDLGLPMLDVPDDETSIISRSSLKRFGAEIEKRTAAKLQKSE